MARKDTPDPIPGCAVVCLAINLAQMVQTYWQWNMRARLNQIDRVEDQNQMTRVHRIDHILLAMPAGRENEARAFYQEMLGIPEIVKPPQLAARGGCWFEAGELKVHLGVERDFAPARKAHPAFVVDDLKGLMSNLKQAGYTLTPDAPLEVYDRIFVNDPFGNRIELMQPKVLLP
jgi:catechol 2,3-dioxygenase-like lactoylglutathione lyase family enzyme